MDAIDRRIINALQSAFPLVDRPFAAAAAPLALTEAQLLERLTALLQQGYLSRFAPMYHAERLGGALTLAAMRVPEESFDHVAARINAFPEVSQNYARQHTLNMWFVLSSDDPGRIAPLLAEIRQQTGLPVFNMPKIQEFQIGFKVWLDESGIEAVADPMTPITLPDYLPDETDRQLISATQGGLPLVSQPYQTIAIGLGIEAEEVMARLQRLLASGIIRRIGAVPNHYRLGLRGNGMTVWNLPDEEINTLGKKVGALGFVTHCYQRPRHLPDWPYNLFAMVHGVDAAAVQEKVGIIRALLHPHGEQHEILFSSRILKKTGFRLHS